MKNIKIIDSTLRDGNHTVGNNFSIDDIRTMCKHMDNGGIDYIEIGYGYGLGSYKDGNKPNDIEILKAAKESVTKSKIAVLVFPNKANLSELEMVLEEGVDLIRIATQATDVEPSKPYIELAKNYDVPVNAFLMMSHRADFEKLTMEAMKSKSYGASSICITDSAGAMTPTEVREKVSRVKNTCELPVGFHSHDNMGLAVGNSILAVESGAEYIDTALCGLGAGGGNTKTEYVAAVLEREGYEIQPNLFLILDACKILSEIVAKYGVNVGNSEETLMLGYAGTYSSFMNPAIIAAEKYDVDFRDILLEASRRKLVAGEEYLLEEIAKNIKGDSI